MKIQIPTAFLFTLLACSVIGQTNEVQVQQQPALRPQIERPRAVVSTNRFSLTALRAPSVSGVAPKILTVDNPLQLINPFAPARYGDGLDNLVVDISSGRAQGIALVSINF